MEIYIQWLKIRPFPCNMLFKNNLENMLMAWNFSYRSEAMEFVKKLNTYVTVLSTIIVTRL